MAERVELIDNKEQCPNCHKELQGDPIPESSQIDYGATHFSQKIGISNWDSVYAYKCPFCHHTWPRTDAPRGGMFRTFNIERS